MQSPQFEKGKIAFISTSEHFSGLSMEVLPIRTIPLGKLSQWSVLDSLCKTVDSGEGLINRKEDF